MNAKVVYQVAKALPNQELDKLFEMLQADIKITYFTPPQNIKKQNIITNEKAIKYLLNTVFSKKL